MTDFEKLRQKLYDLMGTDQFSNYQGYLKTGLNECIIANIKKGTYFQTGDKYRKIIYDLFGIEVPHKKSDNSKIVESYSDDFWIEKCIIGCTYQKMIDELGLKMKESYLAQLMRARKIRKKALKVDNRTIGFKYNDKYVFSEVPVIRKRFVVGQVNCRETDPLKNFKFAKVKGC